MKPISQVARELDPIYFAFVMATGIISIAAYYLRLWMVAVILFYLNTVAYSILFFLSILRITFSFAIVRKEMAGFERAPALFTIVPGTCVLGNQYVILFGNFAIGIGLWIIGVVLWAILLYFFFSALLLQKRKPLIMTDPDGGWLIYVVGTQAVSILTVLISPSFSDREALVFFAAVEYGIGCWLYAVIIVSILYRLFFSSLDPGRLSPLLWINMGAAAITTLAGATLIIAAPSALFLESLLLFLRGAVLFSWAITTWWIPLLVVLSVWRYAFRSQAPVVYESRFWGMVFPLGMYSACTFRFAQSGGPEFIITIARVFIYIALVAWALSFVGLLRKVGSSLSGK